MLIEFVRPLAYPGTRGSVARVAADRERIDAAVEGVYAPIATGI